MIINIPKVTLCNIIREAGPDKYRQRLQRRRPKASQPANGVQSVKHKQAPGQLLAHNLSLRLTNFVVVGSTVSSFFSGKSSMIIEELVISVPDISRSGSGSESGISHNDPDELQGHCVLCNK